MLRKKGKETFLEAHEGMLKLCECPICMNRIGPPVQVCTNGHAVCRDCLAKIEKCPICNSHFTSNKNTLLDKMLQECVFPCKYSETGCKVKLKLAEIENHESQLCKHRTIICPLRTTTGLCLTESPAHSFQDHVFNFHTLTPIQGTVDRELPTREHCSTSALIDKKTSSILLEVTKVDKNSETCLIAYYYVGDVEDVDKWVFEVEFRTHDGIEKMKFRSLLSPPGWGFEDLRKAGRCLEMRMSLLKRFSVDGCLKFSVKIESIAVKLIMMKVLREMRVLK